MNFPRASGCGLALSAHGGVGPTISITIVYYTVKPTQEAEVIDQLEVGDEILRYKESGLHYERLADSETAEIAEFYHLEPEI